MYTVTAADERVSTPNVTFGLSDCCNNTQVSMCVRPVTNLIKVFPIYVHYTLFGKHKET